MDDNIQEFEDVINRRIELIKEILASKAEEYSTDTDRFQNFNEGASLTKQSPERTLWGYAAKHFVSILKMLDDIDKNIPLKEEVVDEKLGDSINYLILLEGLMKIQRIRKYGG